MKTDRRDAVTLAQTLRAGQLTAVWIPDEPHEAMRDLMRLWAIAKRVHSGEPWVYKRAIRQVKMEIPVERKRQ